MKLTPVVFTFYTPLGVPIGETDFSIVLVRPGFHDQVGVIAPETIEVRTDAQGTATVNLAPSNSAYFVKVDNGDTCENISFRFFVPESDLPVIFQDLVDIGQYNPADVTQETIRLIIDSAASSKVAAAAALESESNAKDSELAAAESASSASTGANAAILSAAEAKASEQNAAASANVAAASELVALNSATAAEASKVAAKASETNAKASEISVSNSATTASNKANEAALSAAAAKLSEQNATASDDRVSALKVEVETTYQSNVLIKQEMDDLHAAMLAIGSGWTPKFQLVQDGASRVVLQIVDWQYGTGTKPPVGYMGATGIVATSSEATNIRGANGADGSSFTVNASGPISERGSYDSEPAGFAFLSTDSGMLYIRQGVSGWSDAIPFGKGDKGDTGDRGADGPQGIQGPIGPVGPANTLSIGTVTSSNYAAATITGTAPNQVLNLVIQKGDKGDTGQTGADGQGWSMAQSNKLAGIQDGATKNLTDAVLLERSNHTGGFNGFGVMNDMRNSSAKPFSLPPSAFFGRGTYSGLVLGTEIGIPVMGLGTGRVDAQWSDSTAGYGVMRSFEGDGGRRFTCYAMSADTWSPWRETTHRANMYGTQPLSTISDAGNAASRNVQALPLDTEAGRLMPVGAFGLGRIYEYLGADLDNRAQFPTGTSYGYLVNAAGGPSPNYFGYLTVEKAYSNHMTLTVKAAISGEVHRKHIESGVVGPWIKVIDTASAVGAISSGSIIERGTNANGEYVRFADGLQICTVTRQPEFSNPSNLLVAWVFPVGFAVPPCVHINSLGSALPVTKNYVNTAYGIDAVGASVACLSPGAFTAGDEAKVSLQATAIGKWK